VETPARLPEPPEDSTGPAPPAPPDGTRPTNGPT
jgi:hypothetical protein